MYMFFCLTSYTKPESKQKYAYFMSTITIIKIDIPVARVFNYSVTKERYMDQVHDNFYILLQVTDLRYTANHTGLARSSISTNTIQLKKKTKSVDRNELEFFDEAPDDDEYVDCK